MELYYHKLTYSRISVNDDFKVSTSVQPVELKCSPIIDGYTIEQFNIDEVLYPRHIPLFQNNTYNFTCMNENKNPKIILFWNKKYTTSDWFFGLGKEIFSENRCPVTNCETTNNRSRLKESSLILFSMYNRIHPLPKWRSSSQRWIFALNESPMTIKYPFNKYNGLFNLSVTHRFNSNFTPFYSLYMKNKWERNLSFNISKNFSADKTELIFTLVSHCKASSKRHLYIKELRKYIKVDVYGGCGKRCPVKSDKWMGTSCKEYLAGKYKFYLAFENSICRDYITEKFFYILNFPIIPIVNGIGEYDKYVPKSGYINVYDFKRPKDLAYYLHYLNSNSEAYNSYFKWKQYVNFLNNFPRSGNICEMCIMLNLEHYFGIKYSVIERMDQFWNYKNECKSLNTKNFTLI